MMIENDHFLYLEQYIVSVTKVVIRSYRLYFIQFSWFIDKL